MVRKNMCNFALSKRKCAYLRDPRNSFCLIKSKETMNTIIFHDYQAQQRRGKYSHSRQIASSFCGNIVTADRILPQKDEALSRQTKYTMLRDGVLSHATACLLQLRKTLRRETECLLRLRKHSGGGQNTRCNRMEYSHGRQSTCHNCGNIPTADRVLSPFCHTGLTKWQREGGGT